MIVAVGFIFGGISQAFLPRVLSDHKTGRVPAFKIHRPAPMGLTGVPGDEIKPAFAADDGCAWLHDNGFSDDD
jgi:hypothetical protein